MNENEMVASVKRPSSRAKEKKALAAMVISSMMLAIALIIKVVFMYIPMANWPNGGSISLVLIPLVLTSLYCGPVWGGFVGISYGLINFFIDGVVGWSSNPYIILLSFVLDYFLAFGSCAIAGLFRKAFFEKKAFAPSVSVLIFGAIRLVCHLFSGMLVFNSSADYEHIIPDFTWGGFVYSITYNSTYMIPSIVICMIVITLMLSALYTTFRLPLVTTLISKDIVEEEETHKLPPFQSMALYLLLGLAIFSILTLVPQIGMSGFAIIPMGFALAILGYEIYRLVKDSKEENKGREKKIEILYIGLSLLVISLSLAGLLSQFTFAFDIYHPVEG